MFTFALLIAAALLAPCRGEGWTPQSLPVVMLRMDDLAVRSCVEMAQAAIDAVIAKDTPITVSVIAKDFEKSLYADVANYVRTISQNSLVEIISHSYSHTTYPYNDLNWQKSDIAHAQSVLSSITGMLPTAFVPPDNDFNGDTLLAVNDDNELQVFSAKCVWNRDTPGSVINCPSPGAVQAPDIFREGSYMLPAGAVLGGASYWNNKVQPGNVSEAVRWVESQLLNQNFSVVLLNPYEFSTSTECVSVDEDKIAVLEGLIDYGAGRWQFMTLQEGTMYFANDTTLFDAPPERANAKYEFQARLNILVVFIFTGCVLCAACLSFCRTSTEQKIQKKDRIAAELKRKKDIDTKLKGQRQQRDVEMTRSNSGKVKGGKKKIDKSAYSRV